MIRARATTLLAALAALAALAGCSDAGPRAAPLSAGMATLTVSTSGALLPLLLETANQYMRLTPGVAIVVSSDGESTAVRDVARGELSVAVTNLPIDADAARLDVRPLADVAIALLANRGSFNEAVSGVTRAQLRGIITARINNGSALGGRDQRIVWIDRRQSGEHAALAHLLGLADFCPSLSEEASAVTTPSELQARLGALSYAALPYRHPDFTLIPVDGVEPTVASVQSGAYPLRVRAQLVLRKDGPAAARAFADYLSSPAVQNDLLDQMGYAPVARRQ